MASGLRPDWLAWICTQQSWAKMGDLQSLGRDVARELRRGVWYQGWGKPSPGLCLSLLGEDQNPATGL